MTEETEGEDRGKRIPVLVTSQPACADLAPTLVGVVVCQDPNSELLIKYIFITFVLEQPSA